MLSAIVLYTFSGSLLPMFTHTHTPPHTHRHVYLKFLEILFFFKSKGICISDNFYEVFLFFGYTFEARFEKM